LEATSLSKDALTPKQEAFCLAYVQTGNASEAYRRTYDVAEETKPETIWSEASRLVADPKVSARIMELQERAREIALVSVGSLTDELEKARSHAMADPKGAAAAVSAIMGKAKLHKLLEDDKAAGTGVAVTVVIGTRDAAIL
jgi:phage terminase small subunit